MLTICSPEVFRYVVWRAVVSPGPGEFPSRLPWLRFVFLTGVFLGDGFLQLGRRQVPTHSRSDDDGTGFVTGIGTKRQHTTGKPSRKIRQNSVRISRPLDSHQWNFIRVRWVSKKKVPLYPWVLGFRPSSLVSGTRRWHEASSWGFMISGRRGTTNHHRIRPFYCLPGVKRNLIFAKNTVQTVLRGVTNGENYPERLKYLSGYMTNFEMGEKNTTAL